MTPVIPKLLVLLIMPVWLLSTGCGDSGSSSPSGSGTKQRERSERQRQVEAEKRRIEEARIESERLKHEASIARFRTIRICGFIVLCIASGSALLWLYSPFREGGGLARGWLLPSDHQRSRAPRIIDTDDAVPRRDHRVWDPDPPEPR